VFGMSWGEIIIILGVGMFVLGPERIPVAVKWVTSTLRTVRTMAAGAQEQLRGEFGPELEELRRQVADLQSLKEIQELRKLRDLNPRTMLAKNILGDEFSGGINGFLGLNDTAAEKVTGSGVAADIPDPPVVSPVEEPIQLSKSQPLEGSMPEIAEPQYSGPEQTTDGGESPHESASGAAVQTAHEPALEQQWSAAPENASLAAPLVANREMGTDGADLPVTNLHKPADANSGTNGHRAVGFDVDAT
jgi:sec-independent protein translocase protein TatB